MRPEFLIALLLLMPPGPALEAQAQGNAEDVIDLPWPLFRAVQYNAVRHGSTAWKPDAVARIRKEVMEDGAVDPVEQVLLNRLQQDEFTLDLRTQRDNSADPFSITVSGRLDDESLALLGSITGEALADATTQRADESRVAFLMRRGKAGRDELTALVLSDVAARREYSEAIGARLGQAYNEDGKSFDQRLSAVENILQAQKSTLWQLTGEDKLTYRRAVRDAVVIAWHSENSLPLYLAEAWFDDPQSMAEEAGQRGDEMGLVSAWAKDE